MIYTVLPDQSLLDIAIMVYGDATGVLWLLADNPGLRGPEDRLHPGQVLSIRNAAINARQRSYLADFGTIQTIEEPDKPAGIGWWRTDEYTTL